PKEVFLWQDPLPQRDYELIEEEDIKSLKENILASGLSISQLVYTAWASASTYRDSDRRGGANGARIRLAPQRDWALNHPEELGKILSIYEKIQHEFNAKQKNGKKVSIADLIVLGGCAAIELAAKKAGLEVMVPFTPGRVDATQDQTDIPFYEAMEPVADGFRNYIKDPGKGRAEYLLVDKAQLLCLTVPELTVLVGGLRVLGATYRYAKEGVLTETPGVLTNDFFVNLLDMGTEWQPADGHSYQFKGYNRKTGGLKWSATRVDLIFGHHNELRAVAEVYGATDGKEKFVKDFVKAWSKVMNLDRFDIKRREI
ncbi:MAG: peroxidase family protein, partial [bacterium]